MKRVIVLLALALSIAATGCGQTSTGETGTSTETISASEEAEDEPSDAAEPAGEETAQADESIDNSAGSEETVPEELMIEVDGDKYIGIIKDGGFVVESCTCNKENLIVPDTLFDVPVQVIGNSCMSISNVKTVKLPDTVQFVALNAFAWGAELESIDFGEGLKGVGAEIVYACPLIKEIRFPEGMQSIGGCLFLECEALEKVYIPASVTEIDLLEDEPLVDLATCPNVVIVTPKGSAAEVAAQKSGIPVEYPES